MALTVLFLGRLEDVAGAAEIALDAKSPLSLTEVAARLAPELAEAIAGPKVRIALNGQIVAPEAVSAGDGDELAFLPPVSGG